MLKKATLILVLMFGLPAFAETDSLDNEIIYRAAFGSAQDVRLLLSRGASPAVKNAIGQPLVHIAASRTDDEAAKIVKALLDAGMDVNTLNSKGEPVIIEAAKRGNADTVKVILEFLPALKSVQDATGAKLEALAEANPDKAVLKAIRKGLADEEGRLKELQSDDRLKTNLREFSYLHCANQYLNYYVGSGQNTNIDIVAFNNLIKKNDGKIAAAADNLRAYFKFEQTMLKEIARTSKTAVVDQLEALETNENRTVSGVGTDADLNRRCSAIAGQWTKLKYKITPRKKKK